MDLESTLLLSILNALALISSLYYTHAPQSLHASPPTRAPHIYVSSPSPRRLLASPQVPLGSAETPLKEKFLSSKYLVNNWVPVLITIPFEFEGALVLKPTVPSSPRLLKHRRPFESVKGHWVKSPGFVLTDQDLHPSRPRLC